MIEQLDKDIIEAMKAKDKDKLKVLRMVKASLKQERIDHNKEINDELLVDVVSKQIKMRKDSISEFKTAKRDDLIKENQDEIDILMKYLPKQYTKEETIQIITEIFDEVKPTSIKDMGRIMQVANKKLKGRADMKEVSTIVRERLQ